MEMFVQIFDYPDCPLKINSLFAVPQKISLWKFSGLVANTLPTGSTVRAWEAPTSSIMILYDTLWIFLKQVSR